MAKILLINPTLGDLYEKAKVKSSVPTYFPLNLLMIATPLFEKGHQVKLLDLNLHLKMGKDLINELKNFFPDYVGLTFTTPQYSQILHLSSLIKTQMPNVTIVAGGPHITTQYMGTLKESKIDIAVLGEGDFKFPEIIETKELSNVENVAYRKEGQIIVNKGRNYFKNLDNIPFPAVELININDYQLPYTYCRKNPVFPIESSRGCIFGCVYCNKNIFGRTFRVKTSERFIKDLKKIETLGYKEVHILDDGFTTDIDRAKGICREIIKNKISLLFNCPNGIRADRVDLELLKLMKKAGFYRLSFGVESGSQKILNNINKNLKLQDVVRAFSLCRKVGIETIAFFMFGLPGETEEDLKTTIKFAKKLKPDIAKFDIMIPLPSTPIYEEWKKKGYIISSNWDDYGFHKGEGVYNHPTLSWSVIKKHLDFAYRSFYLSPGFIIRRLGKSIKQGTIIKDIKTFLKTKW